MKRHYFVTRDLDDLEKVELELERAGIDAPHMHVLSDDDAAVTSHHLQPVSDLMKRDTVHAALNGALAGTVLALAILLLANASGLAAQMGWLPFILLGVVVLGFSTWEGGLLGIQRPSPVLRRFTGSLRKGWHVLLVDVRANQEKTLARVTSQHPALRKAHDDPPGKGRNTRRPSFG